MTIFSFGLMIRQNIRIKQTTRLGWNSHNKDSTTKSKRKLLLIVSVKNHLF